MRLVLAFALGLTALSPLAAAATVWHVKANAPAGGDGLSWATPFRDLDTALAAAQAGDQIWVTQGRYRPTLREDPNDPRSATFAAMHVELYGGFLGFETSPALRQGLARRTVLDGDIGIPGQYADNAYTVVSARGVVRVDGFRVQNGNSDAAVDQSGGGIQLIAVAEEPTKIRIENCFIHANRAVRGGGFYATLGIIEIVRTRFVANRADVGGGMRIQTVNFKAVDVTFEHNTAVDHGGGMSLASISISGNTPAAQMVNALFIGNSASNGGGVHLGASDFQSGKITLTHCTFADNSASDSGGGVYANTTTQTPAVLQLRNSIVWGNSAVNAGAEVFGNADAKFTLAPVAGPGTFYVDPLFAPGGYQPSPFSPVIDAADSGLLTIDWFDLDHDGTTLEFLPLDLDEGYRFTGLSVDCGAFEL